MSRTRLRFAAFLLCIASASLLQAQVVDHWEEIKTPPLRPARIQEPVRVELPNGMVIFLQEDHELPIISGTAIIRGGSRDVPASKTGLTEIYGQVWRTGGSTKRTGDELDDFLEARAAKVETSADSDSSSISFNTLKEQIDPVFEAWVELLRSPAFREEKIELAKRQINTGISRRNDNPSSIASRESARLLWGANSPYARVPEYATVAAVTRNDLLEWHSRFVHPNNIIIGIGGDFDAKAMEARLRRAFASWKPGPAAPAPDIAPAPSSGVFFVPKEDVTQSTIILVHPGARKDDPDYYAMQVFNEIFAGGFSGRLLNRIRAEKGLAYSVGGGIGTGYDRLGAFSITMGTKSDTTLEAIDALYGEIDEIRTHPVTQTEISQAKESLLNSWIFNIDSRQKILNQRLLLEFYDYPADFIQQYRAGVEKVDIEDVSRVAEKFVHPDQLAVLVVGRDADFDRPLSSLGEVTTIDITIPDPPGVAAASPSPAGDAQGAAVLRKFRDFIGPEDTLAALTSARSETEAQVQTPQGAMQITQVSTIHYPTRRVHQRIRLPMGEMESVITPESGFMKSPMGTQDLPASQRGAAIAELWSDPIFLAKHAGDAAVKASFAGSESIGGIGAAKLDVEAGDARMTLWIDPSDGRLLRRSKTSVAMGQPTTEVTDFSDWGTASGIRYPKRIVSTANGEPRLEATVLSMEMNPTIDETIFQKD